MFLEDTPIEKYKIGSTFIYVKREDLYGQYPAPPLAKLRGARIVLQKLKEQGVKKIAVYDTRISKAGQGIAVICEQLGLECYAGFPQLKGKPISEQHRIAEEHGATLIPMKAGRTAIGYANFKQTVYEKGCHILPLGLTFPETAEAVESVSSGLKDKFNSIVLSTGTGTIASGVARGTNASVLGVSCGMSTQRQWKRIHEINPEYLFLNLILIEPEYEYYTALDTSGCPFPTSPYYDMKAWDWLLRNYKQLRPPILFWNIGV